MNPAPAGDRIKPGTLFLQCFALVGFALAQPLYDLLGPNPTFFVAHQASAIQVIALVAGISLMLPGLLTVLVSVLARVSSRLGHAAWLTLAGLLVSLVLLPPAARLVPDQPWSAVLLALVGGTCFTIALDRLRAVQMFLTVLSMAALLFAVKFLLGTPVRDVMSGGGIQQPGAANNGTPIVMIVFDELPLTALMTPERTINRNRYPSFAALADTAHWFRNASTVGYFTDQAVPAILTGRYPEMEKSGGGRPTTPAPVAANFPRSLFSLVATSHEVHAYESITRLAPRNAGHSRLDDLGNMRRQALFWLDSAIITANIILPEGLAPGLPGINGQWLDFANVIGRWSTVESLSPDRRAEMVLQFIETLESSSRPSLHFLHVVLPHMPLVFLPSGKYYGPQPLYPHGMTKDRWNEDAWEAVQGYQRFLLQLGYVDRLLGEIIERLKSQDLFDEALFIVMGDHGQSYREGTAPRSISDENLADTLLIPLLIKLPGQSQGVVSDRNAESIDVLPTIARVLDSQADWAFDGIDLLSKQPARTTKTVFSRKGSKSVFPEQPAGLQEALERKRKLFGVMDWDSVYRVGPAPELVWQELEGLTIGEPAPFSVELERASAYRSVAIDTSFLPALLRGSARIADGDEPKPLAIALNGTIAATTWTHGHENAAGRFTASLPERLFRDGANRLDLFQLTSGPQGKRLHPIRIEHGDRRILPGQVLEFQRDVFDSRYLIGGLSKPELGHTWSNAPFVQFEFEVVDASGDVALHARVAPYLADGLIPEQVVEILVDNEPLGTWVLTQPTIMEQTLTIPRRLVTKGNFLLEFRLPRAAVPQELGLGGDLRLLGLRFQSLWFVPAEE